MDVRLPDGRIIKNVPEGTTKRELAQKLMASGMDFPAEWLPEDKTAIEKTGDALRDIPRQLGLTARAGLDGAASLADFFGAPVRYGLNKVLPDSMQIDPIGSSLSNSLGLPQPANQTERVVQDIGQGVVGALTPIGIASASKPLSQAAQSVVDLVKSTPGLQLSSAAAGAGAGGAVREAGGSEAEQLAYSLPAAMLAPMSVAGARSGAMSLKNALMPKQIQQAIEIKINNILQPSGMTLSDIPMASRNAIMDEVKKAMSVDGNVSEDVLRRLIDYRLTGATPTRGGITLDPAIVTQQKNAAKMGANSSDPRGQALAQLENQNNLVLQEGLERMGAGSASDPYQASNRLIGGLSDVADGYNSRVRELYDIAKNSGGRQAEFDSADFSNRVMKQLDQELSMGFLPDQFKRTLDDISTGKVPLTIDVAEQFKTQLSTAQRATADGNVSRALGIVRDAIDGSGFRNGQELGEQTLEAFKKRSENDSGV